MSLSLAAKSIPEKIDGFVDKVELNCEKYTDSDWEKATNEYKELVSKYYDNREEYTDAEKMMAARAMGRFHALLLKNGINKGLSRLGDFGTTLPEYIKGFSGNVEGFQLGSALKEFIDKIDIESAMNDLEKALEGIFGDEAEDASEASE